MEKFYCFAGIEVAVHIPDDWMYTDDRMLAPFRISQGETKHTFFYDPVASLSAPSGSLEVQFPGMLVYRKDGCDVCYIGSVEDGWKNAYIRAEHRERESNVQVKICEQITQIGVKTVLNSMGVEHMIANVEGFLFHCAYIDHDGKAILFTAPSGTGKSTQADLWAKYRGAEIINGDRAAVRLADGQLLAEGIPFAGSSEYCKNRSLPIEAIVYLSQAPVTTIRKLRGYEAFSKIWEGVSVCTWDKTDMENVSAVVQKIVERVPVFHLSCTPDESAVMALEDALRKQEIL